MAFMGLVSTLFTAVPSAASPTVPEIIFASYRDEGPSALYRVPASGGDPVRIFSSPYNLSEPAVTRDGSKIAFVWSVRTASTPAGHIGVYDLTMGEPPVYFDAGSAASDESPVWSPDGGTIAFTRTPSYADGQQIWLMDSDGSIAHPIAFNAKWPTYSPSGAEIAFSDSGGSSLHLMNSDGSDRLEILFSPFAGHPSWSPDGHRIAFYGSEYGVEYDGRYPIYTVPARGGRPTLVPGAVGPGDALSWSADSSALYVARFNADGTSTIYAQPIAGGAATRVTQPPDLATYDFDPAFSGQPAAAENVPPAPPRALTAQPAGISMYLSWDQPLVADWARVRVWQLEGPRAPGSGEGTLVYNGRGPQAHAYVDAGRIYSYSAFSVDASGNESLTAASRTVHAVQRPRMTAPSVSSTGSTGKPFVVSWRASEGTRFRVRYAVRSFVHGSWVTGRWRTWLADTRLTSAVFGASNRPTEPREGTTYRFSVEVADEFGNWSDPTSQYSISVPLDDRHREIGYAGAWRATAARGEWLGTSHTTTAAGSSATLKTYLRAFDVVVTTCATCGKLRIVYDGKVLDTIDTYSRTTRQRKLAFASGAEDWTQVHTVQLTAVRNGGRSRIILDAIGVFRGGTD